MGWPLSVAVHLAGISDTCGAHLVLIRLFLVLPYLLKILVDGGYKQGVIDWGIAMFGYVLEVVKRSDKNGFHVLPKRWIVERTFGWFLWQRRLAKDYEHNPQIIRSHDPLHRRNLDAQVGYNNLVNTCPFCRGSVWHQTSASATITPIVLFP
jgi:hypothetical protein